MFQAVRFGLAVVLGLHLSLSLFAQEPKKPLIPHAQDKPPNDPRDPETAAKMMTVPEGFTVEVVAAEPDIVNPVAMAIDERGRFWITESLEYPRREPGVGKDRVKICEDTDGDGKMDTFTVFLDGLNIPSGIAVGHGGIWIANSPDILFVPDADRDGKPDGPAQVVVTGFGRTDTHELPNSLTWGPDGWLYGLNGVFNFSHVKYPKENPNFKEDHKGWPLTCAMFRIHPRTREFQVFCEGTSNPWGIAFNDEGEAFISACVIDHLWHLVETGYYHRQGGPYPPFTWKIESIVKHKHQKAAYCGIHYFDSDAYPEQYRGKLYMGNIHGGCINVDRIERDGSTYKGFGEPDFLTANDAWFMPVVQKTGPDGCLYILDWYDRYHCYQDANRDPAGIDRLKGRLYRVRYNGKQQAKLPQGDAIQSARPSDSVVPSANSVAGTNNPFRGTPEPFREATEPFREASGPIRGANHPLRGTPESLREGSGPVRDAAEPLREATESLRQAAKPIRVADNQVREAELPPKVTRVYPQIDLAKETDEQLIDRLGAKNDFIRWTATRLLQERSTDSLEETLLKRIIRDGSSPVLRRHALFALAGVTDGRINLRSYHHLASLSDPAITAWRTRLYYSDPSNLRSLTQNPLPQLPRSNSQWNIHWAKYWSRYSVADSPAVRLQQVVGISKIPSTTAPLEGLLKILAKSEGDRLIPQIVWQNLHPRLEDGASNFVEIVAKEDYLQSKPVIDLMPRVTDRILGRQTFDAKPVAQLFVLLRDDHPQVGRQVLEVISAKVQSGELKGEKLDQLKVAMAEPMTPLLVDQATHPLASDAALLAASWGDPRGLPQVRRSFTTRGGQADLRLKSLSALISAKDDGVLSAVSDVLADKDQAAEFKSQVLLAIARLEDAKVADAILTQFAAMEPSLQPSAIELLTQRASWSMRLLAQIGEKKIAATAINLNQARRIQALKDKDLSELLNRHWGQVRDTRNPDRDKVVAEMKSLIRNEKTPGDPFAGEKVFKRVCAACHKIYGEGPDIGPDITLNGRNDFNQLLSNVFDPSLVIGAGYRVCTVVTTSGRVQSGLLVEDSLQRVVLKPVDVGAKSRTVAASDAPVAVAVGKQEVIPRDEIDEFKLNELSLMPEGLEKQLTPQEIIDLFAFITLDKHPKDPSAKRLPGVSAVSPRNSLNPTDFAVMVGEILPGFSTSESGELGVGLLIEHLGRDNVLRTHPVNRDKPCVLSMKLTPPADKKTKLILDVAHDVRGDWRLVVRGNGQRMADEMISKETCSKGWRTLSIDLTKFAGQELKLDLVNQANDWSNEFGYWGGARIVSE